MVGHQAKTEDPDAAVREVGAERVELHLPVLAGVKGRLTAGTALSDVIGKAGFDAACVSRHEIKIVESGNEILTKTTVCSVPHVISMKSTMQAVPDPGA